MEDLGVVDGLVQLSFLVQSMLGRVVGAHDLTVIGARLIGVLRDRDLGMMELARILELEKSSVTGLVDRAERRGLVQRVPAPEDRRAVRVTLTAKGRHLAATVFDEVAVETTTRVAQLSQAQQKSLSQLATSLVFADAQARNIPL